MGSPIAEFREVVSRFVGARVRDHSDAEFDEPTWRKLSELGLFDLIVHASGAELVEAVAIIEDIGAAGLVGPFPEAVMAHAALADAGLGSELSPSVPTVTWDLTLVPWGTVADAIFLVERDADMSICIQEEGGQAIGTLGGENWVRTRLSRVRSLGSQPRAVALGELSVASFVIGAGSKAVRAAAEYAKDRRQFGQPIAAFQAVTHPLARHWSRLAAARDLVGKAALHLGNAQQGTPAYSLAAQARLCATEASNDAVYSALQTLGGMGFVADSEVGRLARRVRQTSLMAVPLDDSRIRARSTSREVRSPSG